MPSFPVMTWPRLRWPTRIWQQFFLTLLLFAVVPLMILAFLLTGLSEKAVKTSVLRDHQELARRAAGEVYGFVAKPQELLQTLAAIIGVSHTDPWRQETAIVELALRYPMFRRVASVDIEGNEIAVSPLGSPRRNLMEEPAFQEARTGRIHISQVHVDQDAPEMTLAVPVVRWGKPAGALVARVNLRDMWTIVDGIRIGRTGHACLVNNAGILIAHPNKKLVLAQKTLVDNKELALILRDKTGSREALSEDGTPVVLAYAPVATTDWRLMVIQSAQEAFAFSRILRIQVWVFVFLGTGLALAMSLFLAGSMSRPLQALLEGTRRVARKDLDTPVPVTRHDEVGDILFSFNTMLEQLKAAREAERMSAIGKTATSIAHDLKNSLVLVDTYMQLLPERKDDPEFMKNFIRIVPLEMVTWKNMLSNMVDFARTASFPMERTDINALVGEVARLTAPRVQQNGISLKVATDNSLAPVFGNSEKLKQALLNLMANALEATPPGGTVCLATNKDEASPGGIILRVDNTGPAIPPDRLIRIFDPFYTTKTSGLGLGLAICREIVERHQGSITALSGQETGASFVIRLPVQEGVLHAS